MAALFGAKRDGIGMHGIAPQAALTSYRIFDAHGSFGGLTGGAILPSLVSHAQTQDITLLNNSWASSYEITDLSKSAVGASLGAELSAWQSAVGQSNKEIARIHNLSEVTIKHHLKSLRSKLGARNRTHAVCRAIELGIADDDTAFA